MATRSRTRKPARTTKHKLSRAGGKRLSSHKVKKKTTLHSVGNTTLPGRTLIWLFPFLAALLPILILSLFAYRTAAGSVEDLVEATNISAASNVSQQVSRDMLQVLNLTSAIASLPGTISGVREQDAKLMRTRLKPVVLSSPYLSRGFVTTSGGTLWTDYPLIADSVGGDFSDTSWYITMSERWKPLVSAVYIKEKQSPQAFTAIAAPIKDESGHVLGIMVFEYLLSPLGEQLANVSLSETGYLFILDHMGRLIAHPDVPTPSTLFEDYAKLLPVRAALEGQLLTQEYVDPLNSRRMLATFIPISIGDKTWVVVAAQPVEEAYAPLQSVKLRIALASGVLVIITLMMMISLARTRSHNEQLNRALKAINQKLREVASIVESSNDAIIGLSKDGKIRTWNDAATLLFGYKEKEIHGKELSILAQKQRPTVSSLLSRMKKGKEVKHIESVWKTKEGESVPVSLIFSPVKDEKDHIVGASVIVQDISERRRIEQMKDNFISFVAHQLKAPVSSIRWYVELILEEKLSKSVRELLVEIQDINLQGQQLISDLLNVSRINRGVIKATVSRTSLKEIITAAVRNYCQPIKDRGLALKWEKMDKDIFVLADKEKMADAVSNSISNAIKHTKKGSISVSVRIEGKDAFVDVTDTGAGMDKEILGKLFTRDQVLGSSAKADKSAGLGLFIAKHFMELQKGDITVTSTVGKGSTFTYRIPISSSKIEDKRKKSETNSKS